MTPLDIGQRVGGERLLLWLPMTITHVIDENSPLYNWKDLDKASQDCDATIVVWVSALKQQSSLGCSDTWHQSHSLRKAVHAFCIADPIRTGTSPEIP